MNVYTAEDFANAKFARHPYGSPGVAARFDDGDSMPWMTDYEIWLSDQAMADHGWVPVREAADQPITLDALRDAWEGAEVVTDDKPVREGDLLIERRIGEDGKAWGVLEASQVWAGDYHGTTVRILHRAPKPKRVEDDERLKAMLRALVGDPALLADWLAERGVRVIEGDEQ